MKTNKIRRQLTLFVDGTESETIEKVRSVFNPIQSKLIKSHVTLCREDEFEDLEKIISNLESSKITSLVITFGEVIRFDNGKGVLLPASGNNDGFHDLRKYVLRGVNDIPRIHEPHITLMHPRNSTCTDYSFEQIRQTILPRECVFKKITLIEQADNAPWEILREFFLSNED